MSNVITQTQTYKIVKTESSNPVIRNYSPYLKEDGYWYYWNNTVKQFVKGEKAQGKDGYSPTISITEDTTKTPNEHIITITNRENSESIIIKDGKDSAEDILVNGISAIGSDDIARITMPTKITELTNDSDFSIIAETGNKIDLTIDSTTYKIKAILFNKNGTQISESTEIDLPLETMVINASYDKDTKEIILTLKNGETTKFSVADLISGLINETTLNTELTKKVDKVDGKGLSTEDYTTNEKNKLEKIEIATFEEANVYLGLEG